MTVEQVYNLVNDITKEHVGEEDLIREDLSNVVQMGDTIQNVMGLDNYVRQLVDHIGRMIFVDRSYSVKVPSVVRDGWEYGSILEKISTGLPAAVENEDWMLEDGQSYDPFIFHKPDVLAKFYNDRTTFEIDMSFTEDQVKSAFSSPTQLNAFFSMIRKSIQNSLTIKLDGLIMRTINNMTGLTMYDLDSTGSYSGKSGVRAVNVLHLYNQTVPQAEQLSTANELIRTPDGTRMIVNVLKNYIDRISTMSTVFNLGGQPRFTPKEALHVVMLSELRNAADVYLQSSVFHDQYTSLPSAETVTFWQGSGEGFDLSDTSKIKIKTPDGHDVDASGILAVMFDRDALGVCNLDQKVNSSYNPKASFFNEFWKSTCGFYNDLNENFIVFYAA